MYLNFGHPRTCRRCKSHFSGKMTHNYCGTCRAFFARRSAQRDAMARGRRFDAPTPAQEAYALGDPELYAQALRGELD